MVIVCVTCGHLAPFHETDSDDGPRCRLCDHHEGGHVYVAGMASTEALTWRSYDLRQTETMLALKRSALATSETATDIPHRDFHLFQLGLDTDRARTAWTIALMAFTLAQASRGTV